MAAGKATLIATLCLALFAVAESQAIPTSTVTTATTTTMEQPVVGVPLVSLTPAPGTVAVAVVSGSMSLTGFTDIAVANTFASDPQVAKTMAAQICAELGISDTSNCFVTFSVVAVPGRRLDESRRLATTYKVVIQYAIFFASNSPRTPDQVLVAFSSPATAGALQTVVLSVASTAGITVSGLALIDIITPLIEKITSTTTTATTTGCDQDKAAAPCEDEDASPCDNATATTSAPCTALTDTDTDEDASVPSRLYLDTSVSLPFKHAVIAGSGAVMLLAAGVWLSFRRSRAAFVVPAGEDTWDLMLEAE